VRVIVGFFVVILMVMTVRGIHLWFMLVVMCRCRSGAIMGMLMIVLKAVKMNVVVHVAINCFSVIIMK
jgi:hypothetical protein